MLVQLLLAATLAAPGQYPLAAAIAWKGNLYVVNVPSRTATEVPLDGMVPEDADLSPDKKLIAVAAKPKGKRTKAPWRLYLVKTGSWEREPVKVDAQGDQRFPRFGEGGKYLYFSAAHTEAEGGPANPLRIHRLEIATGKIEEIPTDPGACEFNPVPVGPAKVAHITTHCAVSYKLVLTEPARKRTDPVVEMGTPRAEVAASPDGSRIVYTAQSGVGFDLMLTDGRRPPRRLHRAAATSGRRVQPRFICPRDLVFLADDKVWVLDTKAAKATELLDFKAEEEP